MCCTLSFIDGSEAAILYHLTGLWQLLTIMLSFFVFLCFDFQVHVLTFCENCVMCEV